MSITVIVLLFIFGILLFLSEFLIFPGLTVSGIGGLICFGIAIYGTYTYYGNATGTLVLASSIVAVIIAFTVAFRGNTWKRFTLQNNIEGRVDLITLENGIEKGSVGKTISRLAPMGKVMINKQVYEAKSTTGYLDAGTEIEVIKTDRNILIVKPRTT